MTIDTFNNVVDNQLEYCKQLVTQKGAEYNSNCASNNTNDRLVSFKNAAALLYSTPKQALCGMLSKHVLSVFEMCAMNKTYEKSKWIEKITDTINYLLLLRALVEEDYCE